MSIPPRFISELKSRLTLSDIIGRKVRLQRAGREFKGCCPFHQEKTPSFTVNDDKEFYHCFGCGAHGSVVDFVMAHDNLSFPEAVETLAAEVGMDVPRQTPQERQKAKEEKDLYALVEMATQWMEQQLRSPANKEAYDYIINRGVSEDLLRAYRIGYAPADRQVLRSYLKSQDFSDSQMIEAGVLRPAGKNGQPYAFFRERIVFPVTDRRGRPVAFGGRILPDHLRAPDQGDYTPAKYMNSSDMPLFHKGRMLYGEPQARQAAIDDQDIIVVEGYLDVVACAKAAIRGAVAPLGTALTEEQILLLWKMIPSETKAPILCFDGDQAGRRAAARACERLLPHLKPDHTARFAFLPEGQDPDSLINTQGGKAFQAIIDTAMPLVDFLWGLHTEDKEFTTPESRAGLNKTLEQEVTRITDRSVQHYYRQAIRLKIRENFGWKKEREGQNRYSLPQGQNNSRALHRPTFDRKRMIQAALLACILNYPALFDAVEEQLGTLEIKEKRLDALRQSILLSLVHDSDLDAVALKDHLIDEGHEGDLKAVLSESTYTHAGFARPGSDIETARRGWNDALNALSEEYARQEQKLHGVEMIKQIEA